jgi:hypothetical protein
VVTGSTLAFGWERTRTFTRSMPLSKDRAVFSMRLCLEALELELEVELAGSMSHSYEQHTTVRDQQAACSVSVKS